MADTRNGRDEQSGGGERVSNKTRTISDMPWFKFFGGNYLPFVEIASPESAGLVFKAVCCYVCEKPENAPQLTDPLGQALFQSIKKDIDDSFETYQKKVEGGKLGGRPKKGESKTIPNHSKPNVTYPNHTEPYRTEEEVEEEVEVEEEPEEESDSEGEGEDARSTDSLTIEVQGSGSFPHGFPQSFPHSPPSEQREKEIEFENLRRQAIQRFMGYGVGDDKEG